MTARTTEPLYDTAILAGRGLFGFWRLKPRTTGAHHIPATGGAVIAMTHFGYLEFALVEWTTWMHRKRRIRFMAKQEVFHKPLVGTVMRGMRHIPVDMAAGSSAYTEAVAALRRGELIGVFPEAGVSASFTVREFKTGAARLAAEAGVPLLPVGVWGGHRLLTKNHRIGFRERFGVPVHFAFGRPLTVSPTDDAKAVTATLRDTIVALVEGLQARYPVDGTGQWWQPRHLGGTAPTPGEAAAADEARRVRREAEAAARASRTAARR
ncbi:lysophospholipid acyltransferase family protein [Marisediminicola sp. LYQ134]|uniref:lysophospholipid acyltransferase family protein n=1 Tax=Marisediminicola sp. LYQ134 TaxID=3391061 RepID=UPI003983621F